jgi:hypothetical protein
MPEFIVDHDFAHGGPFPGGHFEDEVLESAFAAKGALRVAAAGATLLSGGLAPGDAR